MNNQAQAFRVLPKGCRWRNQMVSLIAKLCGKLLMHSKDSLWESFAWSIGGLAWLC